MFAPFFYLLRARGLKVSITEWLDFVRAVDKGLFDASFTQFYYLARSVLVKSEADFDRFDSVFLEYFRDVALASDELPPELLDWLNNPSATPGDAEVGGRSLPWTNEEIERMFEERLREQREEHNGGSYWIGTNGVSPFGNAGHSLNGIRVGGKSGKRLAMRVAGERRYRDFRDDAGLNTRSFQLAFRRLRQFSSRIDAPRTELDVDATIRETCDNAGRLEIVFDKPRKNTVKLMLLIDSGGSMDQHSGLCSSLFQAVSKSNHFKDLKVYFFHNCFTARFYKTPALDYRDSVETDWILRNLDGEYKVIVVGDALMELSELTGRYRPGKETSPTGLLRLRTFKRRYRNLIWFTPSNNEAIDTTYWGKSYDVIKKEVEVRPLTIENLATGMKKLMVAR